MTTINLVGQRFGRLTVLEKSTTISSVGALWVCACDCGGRSVVNSLKLRSGKTQSCGCHRKDVAAQMNKTHGLSNKSGTYRSWKEMRQRCNNPKSDKWHWYGGRGISVCERWNSYELFLADMGDRPEGTTLDRIDNDGNYSPDNCRWVSQLVQTRKQSKHKLRDGISDLLKQDRQSGMSYRALGAKYGVSATTAHKCCTGETWA